MRGHFSADSTLILVVHRKMIAAQELGVMQELYIFFSPNLLVEDIETSRNK